MTNVMVSKDMILGNAMCICSVHSLTIISVKLNNHETMERIHGLGGNNATFMIGVAEEDEKVRKVVTMKDHRTLHVVNKISSIETMKVLKESKIIAKIGKIVEKLGRDD